MLSAMHAPALVAALCLALASCGGVPPGAKRAQALLERGEYQAAEAAADDELRRFRKHPTLWTIKVRAAMGRGDNAAAVGYYREWRELRGADDSELLETMALTLLWQGLRTPSPTTNAEVIGIIERFEIELFAGAVGDRVLDDSDLVAAAASVAVLRSNPAAPSTATDLLRSDDPAARRIVVAGIGRKIGKRAREDLLPALKDSDAGVRRAAVVAIGAMGDAADLEALRRLAAHDVDGPVRAAALTALASRGREIAYAAGSSAARDDYLGARLAAVEALYRADGLRDANAQLAALARGEDLFVALRAAALLLDRTGERIDAPVRAALAAEAWQLRAAAVRAAGAVTTRERALDWIGQRLADTRVEVRLAAARALLRWKLESRATPIFAAALTDASDHARIDAAGELAALRDERGLPALSALCGAASPDTRAAAVRAHARAGRPSDGMVGALADDNLAVRIAAAETLLALTRR